MKAFCVVVIQAARHTRNKTYRYPIIHETSGNAIRFSQRDIVGKLNRAAREARVGGIVTAICLIGIGLDDNLLMDENKTTVFTATGNKLFTSEGMQFPADWSVYGQTAHVGTDGIDVSVSDATYTVKTPRGLAWIAWVTNNGKTILSRIAFFPAEAIIFASSATYKEELLSAVIA